MKSFVAVATALSLGSIVSATPQCPLTGICYDISIPDTTASSGNGDVYFQVTANTDFEWIGFGQGNSMSGANIFVVYGSSDGTNVTVSPRLGTGEVEPQHDSSTHITVLEGSGVANGKLTANFRCSNCQKWSGGSMDFTASSGTFIYSALSGSLIKSDDLSQSISQHNQGATTLSFNFKDSTGGSESANPFLSTSDSTSGGSGSGNIPVSCTPIGGSATDAGDATSASASSADGTTVSGCPTSIPASLPKSPPAWVTSCFGNGNGYPTGVARRHPQITAPPMLKRESNGCPAGYAPIQNSGAVSADGAPGLTASQSMWMPLAHGVLACLAFVGLFPIGGILIRVANFTGLIWVHAALQCVSYLIYIIAFGIGVYMAGRLGYIGKAHPVMGIALFMILLLQPLFGVLHHKLFKKYGHRTFWSYAHLFHGRIAILLGMINGGLGIQLAGTTSMGGKVAYGVITAIMALVYIAAIIYGERKRRRNGPPTYEKSQKVHQLRDLSSGSEDNFTQPQQAQHAQRPSVTKNDIHHQEYYGAKGNRF